MNHAHFCLAEETQKGTPIAVTNPIRNMKDHHEARLPRDILKKYENKSREVRAQS